MRPRVIVSRLRLAARLALGGLVLGGFTLALAMDASPELHRKIHHDADSDEHECLATVLHAGGCDSALPAPLLAALPGMLLVGTVLPLHPQWVAPLFLTNSVLEHAPPVSHRTL